MEVEEHQGERFMMNLILSSQRLLDWAQSLPDGDETLLDDEFLLASETEHLRLHQGDQDERK